MDNILHKAVLALLKSSDRRNKMNMLITTIAFALISIVDWQTGRHVILSPLYLVFVFYFSFSTPYRFGVAMLCLGLTVRAAINLCEQSSSTDDDYASLVNIVIIDISWCLMFFVTRALRGFAEDAQKAAHNDALTQLLTRRYINDLMPLLLEDLRRQNRSFSIASIDCDNFKAVNDTWGHAAGDAVLKTIAQVMLASLRTTDLCVRLGGDEFIIIFLGTTQEHVSHIIERCISALNKAMQEKEWPVTFSVGVVNFTTIPEHIDDAIRMADEVMYKTKKIGKNGIIYETCA